MLSTPSRVDWRVHADPCPIPRSQSTPVRRRFTAEYKLSILHVVDAATEEPDRRDPAATA